MAEGEKSPQILIEQIEGLFSRRAQEGMSLSVILQNMPSLPEEDIDKLLTTCSDGGLYDYQILAAVRYDRIESIMHNMIILQMPVFCLSHLLQGNLLVDLADEGLWPPWNDILSCYSQDELRYLAIWLAWNVVNSVAVELFEVLFRRFASDGKLFVDLTRLPVVSGCILQYERLLYGADNLVEHFDEDDGEMRRSLMCFLVKFNVRVRHETMGFQNSFHDCLVLTCQAGLLIAPESRPNRNGLDEQFDPQHAEKEASFAASLIARAVTYNQPDMVRFLYSTGTVNNKEVFKLSGDPDLVEKCARDVTTVPSDPEDFPSIDDVIAAREILSFLVAKASEPRSLKSLCLVEVSKGLGWGNARNAAVKEMDIPLALKDDLLTNCDKTLLRYLKEDVEEELEEEELEGEEEWEEEEELEEEEWEEEEREEEEWEEEEREEEEWEEEEEEREEDEWEEEGLENEEEREEEEGLEEEEWEEEEREEGEELEEEWEEVEELEKEREEVEELEKEREDEEEREEEEWEEEEEREEEEEEEKEEEEEREEKEEEEEGKEEEEEVKVEEEDDEGGEHGEK